MPKFLGVFFFSSRRRHTRCLSDWSSDVCSSDLYQLLEELGRGGMGVVFHGFDPAIGRPVAIKIIRASQFASALEDAEFKLRFAREAAAAGRLSHPNIVTIYQFAEEGGVRYLVQELVHGRSLEQMLSNNQPQDRNTAVSILSQVADALDYRSEEHTSELQ